MKPQSRTTHMLLRGQDTGAITKSDIERRARELALIRAQSEDYSEADLEAAQLELFGDPAPASMVENSTSDVFLSRDPSEPRGTPGHHYEEISPEEDEENEVPERLAIQGVEEAQHDLMVRARQRELDEAGQYTREG